jgi:hypothetical protein
MGISPRQYTEIGLLALTLKVVMLARPISVRVRVVKDPGGWGRAARGRAVQVDPIKPTLKPPGTKRLKLEYGKLLSRFALNFNLRRYSVAWRDVGDPAPEDLEKDAAADAAPVVGRCRLPL